MVTLLPTSGPSSWRTRVLACVLGAGCLAAAVASSASADNEFEPPIPSTIQATDLDSGWLRSRTDGVSLVYATVVVVPAVDWVRLDLAGTVLAGDMSLGNASYLRISSLKDGAEQILDSVSLREWGSSSAYFNGDKVLVQLYAGPAARSRVKVPNATVSAASGGVATICGTTDDRVASTDPREGRLMPVGCTAWLFDNKPYCLLTAGHCLNGTSVTVVEFHVPPSLANGTVQHPPPSDQYAVDAASKQFFQGAIGNDWGYLGVFKNSTTYLSPLIAQGSSLITAIPPPATGTARVTGYGVDSGTANQTNQTATGPFVSFTGTTLKYSVDTEGGNSGSPIIRESDGKALGIHTNGGCSSGGGSNSGTAMNNSGLQNAIANPIGICLTNPPSCGTPNAATCFSAHASPACSDAICCSSVCTMDPFCCQSQWDAQCAAEAADQCASSPCFGYCTGDLNADHVVDAADLAILLSAWGGTGCGDLTLNGTIDGADLASLLSSWGACP